MNQSNQYNLASILLLAVLGLLIFGLGAIIFYDDNEEKPTVDKPMLTEQITPMPEVPQQPRIISEPAPLQPIPDDRMYAPQDYESYIFEQTDSQPPLQTGPQELDSIVDHQTQPPTTPRHVREQDMRREPDRRFDAPRQDAAAMRQQQQPPQLAPAPHAPEYGVPRGRAPSTDWRAPEMEPSVSPPRRLVPSYGTPPTYPRYQTPGAVPGYSQPYTQPYYFAPQPPRREAGPGAGYPTPDYRWRPPEQPPYPQPRGSTDRYWEGR